MLLNSHPKAMTEQLNFLQQFSENCRRCYNNIWGKLHKVLVTQLSFNSLKHWSCPSLPFNIPQVSSNSAQLCAFKGNTSALFLAIIVPPLRKDSELSNVKQTKQSEFLPILSILTLNWMRKLNHTNSFTLLCLSKQMCLLKTYSFPISHFIQSHWLPQPPPINKYLHWNRNYILKMSYYISKISYLHACGFIILIPPPHISSAVFERNWVFTWAW